MGFLILVCWRLIVNDINIYKDKRVELTTQLIEGIKFVKLYGWELAFKKIIVDIREKELFYLRKFSIYRAF